MAEIREGALMEVVLESWGGRSYHVVEVLKVCPKRVKVRWASPDVFRCRRDGIYYVPKHALQEVKRYNR